MSPVPEGRPCNDCGDTDTLPLKHDLSLCENCIRHRYGAGCVFLNVADKPEDCTCERWPYLHTQAAGPELSQTDLSLLAELETCPAEKRALKRLACDVGRKP